MWWKNSSRQSQEKIPQPAPKSSGTSDPFSRLVMIARAMKLTEIEKWRKPIAIAVSTRNASLAMKLLRILEPLYYRNELAPNPFLSFNRDNLHGEILLGNLDDSTPVGLDRTDLVRHSLISGQSGGGKTTLMLNMLRQGNGLYAQLFFDRKADVECEIRNGIDSIHWKNIRFNFLCPPDTQCPIVEWRNDFANVFSQLMGSMQRGLSIFIIALDELYKQFDVYSRWHIWDWKTMRFPTLYDLLALTKSNEFMSKIKGTGKDSLLSIIDKLASIVVELEPIISCERGFNISKMVSEKRTISYMIDGLSMEYQNLFIVEQIVRYYHYFKVHGPRNQLNVLMFFDEAKNIVGRSQQDKFIVKDLISKIREFGIGLVCADQIPSEISQAFFSNINNLIFFRHSDGIDLQRLRYSAGATEQQILENYSLHSGTCIVRTSKSKNLLKVKVPFTPVDKFITREEVETLMAACIAELHSDVIPIIRNESQQAEEQKSRLELDALERRFLEHLAKGFDKPASQVYQELGLNSSLGFRLKKKLLGKGYITEISTNMGKAGKRATFLIPNPLVFEEFGIPLGSGRGGPLHRKYQSALKSHAEKLGFTAVIEGSVNGSVEAPDVGLERLCLKIAIELAITSKPSQEVNHIDKNLRLGHSQVIMTFVDKQVMEKTRELAIERYPEATLQRVRFCMVDQFAAILGTL